MRSTAAPCRWSTGRSRAWPRSACARTSRRSSARRHAEPPAALRVVTVIGNRPQFVKAAAVSRLLRAAHDELLVHTGQHHDDELSTVFVEELGVPRPERELGIHGGTNTDQTARMLTALGPLLAAERPDVVLVYGDTNSTLAGGLAAGQARIPVAHVEAGVRPFDPAVPQGANPGPTRHPPPPPPCPSPTAGRDPSPAPAP